METLKQVITGEILLLIVKFHPHQDIMNEEEKSIYKELNMCADILLSKE